MNHPNGLWNVEYPDDNTPCTQKESDEMLGQPKPGEPGHVGPDYPVDP